MYCEFGSCVAMPRNVATVGHRGLSVCFAYSFSIRGNRLKSLIEI